MKKTEIKVEKIDIKTIKELIKEKNLLEFNRDIQPRHVEKMQKSVLDCGILRMPVLGDVSAFDNRKLVIIDGQHLCKALTQLDPANYVNDVHCIIKVYLSKEELINDVAKLNNTQKSWNDADYLYAWVKYGKDNLNHYAEYSDLYNQYQNFEDIPLAFLIDLFVKDKNDFKEGKLEFIDREHSMKILIICNEMRKRFDIPALSLHGLRLWAKERRTNKRDIDFTKLKSRLMDGLKNSKVMMKNREEFRDFVQEVYTKL